jgi:type II secretory pathway pseudopilin PulG
MSARTIASAAGFSLAETLIALGILAAALLSLAQLFTIAAAVVQRARHVSIAAVMASQKLEELRALPGAAGARTADGIELIDRDGSVLPPDRLRGSAYTRRWSVRPHAADPDRLSVIDVRVAPATTDSAPSPENGQRPAGEVVLVTMRAR